MFVAIDVTGEKVLMDKEAEKAFDGMSKEEKDLMYKWIIADRSHATWFSKAKIKRVIFNGPATIVYWSDGDKTVVKCMDGDEYSYETGIAMCMLKKIFGESYAKFKNYLKEIIEQEAEKNEKKKNKAGHDEEKTASGSDANN